MEMKRLFFVLLMAALVLGGCKSKGIGTDEKSVDKDAVYKIEEVEISLPAGYDDYSIADYAICENVLFFPCVKGDKDVDSSEYDLVIGVSDKNGENVTILDCLKEEGEQLSYYYPYSYIDGDKDKVALAYTKIDRSVSSTASYDSIWTEKYVGVFDKNGEKLFEQEIGEYPWNIFFLNDKVIVSDGYNDRITAWNISSGSSVSVKSDGYRALYEGGSGELIAFGIGEDENDFYAFIDPETLEEEKRIYVEHTDDDITMHLFSGYGANELLFLDRKELKGITPGEDETKPVCYIEYSGIYWEGNVADIYLSDDSPFYALIEVYSGKMNDDDPAVKLLKGVKIPAEEVKDKETVSIGCLGRTYDGTEKFIAELNRNNEQYYYSLTEYSNISEFDELITGKNNPDIVMCSAYGIYGSLNLNRYVKDRIFMPLDEFMEKDPEIDGEDIFPSLKAACSYDGKMYTVIPFFNLNTLICKDKNSSGKESVTYPDIEKMLEEHPGSKAFFNASPETVYYNFFSSENNPFISVAHKTCNFDSEEFVDFLQFVKGCSHNCNGADYVTDFDEKMTESYVNDESLFIMCLLQSTDSLSYYEKFYLDDEAKCIGYPNDKGYKGYFVPSECTVGISAKTKHADAAWKFVRYYLTDEYLRQNDYSFPASMKAFDEQSRRLMSKDHNTWFYKYDYVETPPITQSDVDRVKDAILSSGGNSFYDENIIRIIEEESETYFAGEKTAEEAAKMIQSRVSIYLKE